MSVKHEYHCPLCGTQLEEAGLGILICPKDEDHQFIPTVDEKEDTASLTWKLPYVPSCGGCGDSGGSCSVCGFGYTPDDDDDEA